MTSDCLLSELLGSLRLTFLKIPTRLFIQNRSAQCLTDFVVSFICFMAFTESFFLSMAVLGRVEVCALLDLGRDESASPWMKKLWRDLWDVFIPPAIV